jgi:release factor glutamine methyltransferase
MQILYNIIDFFKREISHIYDLKECESLAYIVIDKIFGYNKSDFILRSNETINESQRKIIINIVKNLKKNVPIQYILEEAYFFDLNFFVNSSVLIPRPETEELVSWIINESKQKNSFLDIGTGSGCLIITLNKLLKGSFSAIDVCSNALDIAKINNKKHNTEVNFYQMDILKKENIFKDKFDVILSNPPYVTNSEKKFIKKNVIDHEPHIALFVSDRDPLIFYRSIIKRSKDLLSKEGCLYFEINERFGLDIIQLLNNEGFVNIKLKKDINGKDRMIKAVFK